MVILDNLGLMLAGIFRPPSSSNGQVDGLKNTGGTVFDTRLYATDGDTNRWNFDGALRQVQVGKGLSTVSRQDFKIESSFPDSPESSLNNCTNGVYNSGLGKITQPCLISSTGGAGAITEVIKVWRIRSLANQSGQTCAMMRDLVSAVNFIQGESINTEHTVLI